MIFRRIKSHIEKENWFAVGVDFFIVVAGVFIGLQVANWNGARAERRQASDLMERMVSEAITTRGELADYIKVHQEISERATQLAILLKDKDACLAMDTELTILIVSIADFPPPRFSLSNAQQALDTGSLALIRSNDVQAAIQTITDEMTFIDRQWQRYIIPKQNANREAHKSAGVALTVQGDRDWEISYDYDPKNHELLTPEKICGNTEIIALTANVAVTQKIYIDYLEQVEVALDAYLAILNAET